MRRVSISTALLVFAAALGLGCSELLAKVQSPMIVPSMNARPDLVQLQIATWEWLRASVTSSTFIAGTVIGVIFSEVGRFLVRSMTRAVGVAAGVVRVVVEYRLLVAAVIAAGYYVVTFHLMG